MSTGEKKGAEAPLTLEDVKQKLGYQYARKVAEKSDQLSNRQVFDVFAGRIKSPETINLVLKAAALAVKDLEALNAENERLKMSIVK